ncbi:MAG: hypothetical protein JW995_11470 [Melioribacteraceae bacterium]|nr:hypothetical protein [Melioribacteraceae bacterium]
MGRKKHSHYGAKIKEIMRKSNPWLQAENLPSYLPFFVNANIIDQLRNNGNHLVCGRRGSGKTHLLGALKETINNDTLSNQLAIQISCVGIAGTPQNFIDESIPFSTAKYTRIVFTNFLRKFTYELFPVVEEYVELKIKNRYSKSEYKRIKSQYEEELLKLLTIVENGYSQPVKGKLTEMTQETSEVRKRGSADVEVGLRPNKGILLGGVSFGKDKISAEKKIILNEIESKMVIDLPQYRTQLKKIIELLKTDILFLLIDEWIELDKNLNLDIQPYFAQLLKTVFFNSKNIAVKIATIWYYTNLYDRNVLEKSKGLELGEDIYLGIDLDIEFLDSETKVVDFFKRILFKRFCYVMPELKELEINGSISDFFIEELFDDNANFELLVSASHGIPRDFLELFLKCAGGIDFNFEESAITKKSIRDMAQKIYLLEKRNRLDKSSDSQKCWEHINSYMNNTQHRFFMIKNEEEKRSIHLRKLSDEEIIHPIHSSLSPRDIRNKYKMYIIDYGNYIDWYKSKKFPLDSIKQESIFPVFPADFEEKFKDYIITFEEILTNKIRCPFCGEFIPLDNIVYKVHKICFNCAGKIPD